MKKLILVIIFYSLLPCVFLVAAQENGNQSAGGKKPFEYEYIEDEWTKTREKYQKRLETVLKNLNHAIEEQRQLLDHGNEGRRKEINEKLRSLHAIRDEVRTRAGMMRLVSASELSDFKKDVIDFFSGATEST